MVVPSSLEQGSNLASGGPAKLKKQHSQQKIQNYILIIDDDYANNVPKIHTKISYAYKLFWLIWEESLFSMWSRCPKGKPIGYCWCTSLIWEMRCKLVSEPPNTKVTHKFAKHKTGFRDKVWYWTFGQVPSSLPPQVSPHCHSICLKQSCKFHKYPPARSKHVMGCWISKKENISNQHVLQ